MTDIAVEVHNLGKLYHIGGKHEKNVTLRESVARAASAPYRRVRALVRGESAAELYGEIWALNDVSFEVKHGEVVGIIGRNGAGKSTLLKILSRITEPTVGHAVVYGRVGALLEVGTGFHSELTGRENVFLNGAILGMSRVEIERKFDEIVDFAGIEKFIDTPVKHYSSGMGLRLGFAVAAHLEPEILIVDEVLAVGDAEFQRKCLGKMGAVANEGRTVLLVSHNMNAILSLCSRTIMLEQGTVRMIGETESVIQEYMSANIKQPDDQADFLSRTDRQGGERLRFSYVGVHDRSDQPLDTVVINQPCQFVAKYISPTNESLRNISFGFRVEDAYGQILFAVTNEFAAQELEVISPEGTVRCAIPRMQLLAGDYKLAVWCQSITDRTTYDHLPAALRFTVLGYDAAGGTKVPEKRWHGVFTVPQEWSFESTGEPVKIPDAERAE